MQFYWWFPICCWFHHHFSIAIPTWNTGGLNLISLGLTGSDLDPRHPVTGPSILWNHYFFPQKASTKKVPTKTWWISIASPCWSPRLSGSTRFNLVPLLSCKSTLVASIRPATQATCSAVRPWRVTAATKLKALVGLFATKARMAWRCNPWEVGALFGPKPWGKTEALMGQLGFWAVWMTSCTGKGTNTFWGPRDFRVDKGQGEVKLRSAQGAWQFPCLAAQCKTVMPSSKRSEGLRNSQRNDFPLHGAWWSNLHFYPSTSAWGLMPNLLRASLVTVDSWLNSYKKHWDKQPHHSSRISPTKTIQPTTICLSVSSPTLPLVSWSAQSSPSR